MNQQFVIYKDQGETITLTLNGPGQQNSLNELLLKEFHTALDAAVASTKCRLIVIASTGEFFCSGMDFTDVVVNYPESLHSWASCYADLLLRIASIPKVVVAAVDGKVVAGGAGIVAACDWVVATPASSFKLSEGYWGLIPAMAGPYLIRRMGIQPMHGMALTCRGIKAEAAVVLHLVDEIAPDLNESIKSLMLRLQRVDPRSIGELKSYFSSHLAPSKSQNVAAIETFTRLVSQSQEQIRDFVLHQRLPWETK